MAKPPHAERSGDPPSAVEAALKDSVFAGLDQPDEAAAEKQGPTKPAAAARPANARTEQQRAADKIAAQTGSVANDDRLQGSRLLYDLQSKSSQGPTMLATLIAAGWVLAIVLVAFIRNGRDMANASFYGSNDFIGLIALAVIPVVGFFAISALIRRAQELRNAATAVTQAAIRLAEPETTASEKVASVGQAVRREVNALGDGLERALSRAGELEVMIHHEVTAPGRTHPDNESRLRAPIQELASQRGSDHQHRARMGDHREPYRPRFRSRHDFAASARSRPAANSQGARDRRVLLNGAFGERTELCVADRPAHQPPAGRPR